MENYFSLKEKFNLFLERYGEYYDLETLDFIKHYFGEDINCLTTVNPLMQVYSELGVYGENDFYNEHVQKIKENFDISGNILEVGSGYFPAFGKKMAMEQLRIKSGTITLYDTNLSIGNPLTKNMHTVKDAFSEKTSIKSYDLIVGIMPCEATRLIIKKACEEHKNFYIALCTCIKDPELIASDMLIRFKGPRYYQEVMMKIAEEYVRKYDNGSLEIDFLDPKYCVKSPIIYNKRKR